MYALKEWGHEGQFIGSCFYALYHIAEEKLLRSLRTDTLRHTKLELLEVSHDENGNLKEVLIKGWRHEDNKFEFTVAV